MNTVATYKDKAYYLSDLDYYDGFYKRKIGREINSTFNFLDEEKYIDEIIGYIKLLTNDSYFLKNTNDFNLIKEERGIICMCGCNKCSSLFIIEHIPSSVRFGVGSQCIKKFFPDKKSQLNKIKKDEICLECKAPLYYGNYSGHKKNAEKDKNGNNKFLGHCINCWYN
jgi:hypothetical protein